MCWVVGKKVFIGKDVGEGNLVEGRNGVRRSREKCGVLVELFTLEFLWFLRGRSGFFFGFKRRVSVFFFSRKNSIFFKARGLEEFVKGFYV